MVAFREHRCRWIRNRPRRDCLDESGVFRHIFRSCRLLLILKAKFQKRILEGWFCCTAGEVLVIATYTLERSLPFYNIHGESERVDSTIAMVIDDVDPLSKLDKLAVPRRT